MADGCTPFGPCRGEPARAGNLQPARSPELNPVEHIWDDLREKYFVNRAFPSLDTMEETLCKGINYLAHHPDDLKSLTNFPFLNVTV
jgi:hypothetical protein